VSTVNDRASTDSSRQAASPSRIARWDLDKTYLRTDFDTLRDLIRTAIERPDQKRTVPGAAALLRALGRAGVETHILSGSPEQLRGRLEEKLKLDGVRYASLTLKPNLENILRLRFRALRGQLGYKLPSLLLRRCELAVQRAPDGSLVREILLGDDAEADAFVYSLFADVCGGTVSEDTLREVLERGGAYADSIADALRFARYIEKGAVVDRVLIHLDRQSSPSDFALYGRRVVPFYNYLQAAIVLHEDGWLTAEAVLEVAADLVIVHNFEPRSLARSYLDLWRRGHVTGVGLAGLNLALAERLGLRRASAASELVAMMEELAHVAPTEQPAQPAPVIDYVGLVGHHDPRRKKRARRS
jgi:hypothetical protein